MRHFDGSADHQVVWTVNGVGLLIQIQVQLVADLHRVGRVIARHVAPALAVGVGGAEREASAESLLDRKQQRVVVLPAHVLRRDYRRHKVRIGPVDGTGSRRVHTQSRIQIDLNEHVAQLLAQVIDADRHLAAQLPLVANRELMGVGIMAIRIVETNRAGVLLQRADREQLVQERAIHDRIRQKHRFGRQPTGGRPGVTVVGRESGGKRIRVDAAQ